MIHGRNHCEFSTFPTAKVSFRSSFIDMTNDFLNWVGSSCATTTAAGGTFADAFTPPLDSQETAEKSTAAGRSFKSRRSSSPSTGGRVTNLVSAVVINKTALSLTAASSKSAKAGMGRKGKHSGWWTKSKK